MEARLRSRWGDAPSREAALPPPARRWQSPRHEAKGDVAAATGRAFAPASRRVGVDRRGTCFQVEIAGAFSSASGGGEPLSQLLVDAGVNLNVVVAAGTTVSNSIERVFDFTVAEDVATSFLKGQPAVTGYELHHGPWGQPGARRTVFFGEDSVREEINFFVRPYLFDYQLTDFSGALGELCDLAANQFLFRPVGPRTLVKFYYQFRARSVEAIEPLRDYATNTWLAWMHSYLDAMRAAIDKDPFSA